MTNPKAERRDRYNHDPDKKLASIFAKTVKVGDCLVWQGNFFKREKGSANKCVYPYMYYKSKAWRGNRLVLFLSSGILPEGKMALHTCDNSRCVNPDHLYWGTALDNVKDTYARKRSTRDRITACPHGHPYSGENLRISQNHRYCRTCSWYRDKDLPIEKDLKYAT